MYTLETRKTIYQLIKGAGLITDLEQSSGHTRATLRNIFFMQDKSQNKQVVDKAVKMLRTNNVLTDIQTLIEILN